MTNSHLDGFVLDLDDSIYEEQAGKLVVEVRDMLGDTNRTLVIRTLFAGRPITVMVDYNAFAEAFNDMQGKLMSTDWDESLMQLLGMGGTND